ncbi:MAG: HEAT repeat domain-containing protein [Candidatus Nealsonbacteria bacterium]|nr:HEAT repeat domain-containing protein [Candidatus Nealsonbacteria bacterium]
MHGSYGKYVPVLLLCLLLTMVTGCDTLREDFSFLPGIGGPAAYPPDLPTPERRVNSLRQLARQAAAPGAERQVTITSGLIGAMRDEDDPIVLAEKVRILGEYPSIVADAELEVALQHDDKEVRQAACEAWGRRGNAQAASMLRSMLDGDRSMDVRLTAARALGTIRDPQAVAALATALEDSDPAMQYQAVLSLEKSTGENLDGNVQRWRDYVRRESPPPANPVEVAGRPW